MILTLLTTSVVVSETQEDEDFFKDFLARRNYFKISRDVAKYMHRRKSLINDVASIYIGGRVGVEFYTDNKELVAKIEKIAKKELRNIKKCQKIALQIAKENNFTTSDIINLKYLIDFRDENYEQDLKEFIAKRLAQNS